MQGMSIAPVSYATARDMITAHHYSGKWNASFGRYNIGCFDSSGTLQGVAVYGNLMNPASYSKLANVNSADEVIELNRLWLSDEMGHNSESRFLGLTFKWLREHTPVQVIQSFADGRLGVGTIYKATNFGYYGYSLSQFYRHVGTGITYHHAPFDNTNRPTPFVDRNTEWCEGVLEPFKVKTYRYMLGLNRRARKAIKLAPLPYPEYERGEIPNEPGFERGVNVLVRAALVAEILGRDDAAQTIRAYVEDRFPAADIEQARDRAETNKSVLALKAKI